MSKKLPYFKFYPDNWLTGTISYLPFEDQALFIELCCLVWKNGGFIVDDNMLKMRLSRYPNLDKCLHNLVDCKLLIKDRNTSHFAIAFMSEQLDNLSQISKKRSEAAKSRWDSEPSGMQNNTSASDVHMQNDTIIELELELELDVDKDKQKETVLSFDDFWILYDKKIDRKKAAAAYKKTTEEHRAIMITHIPQYVLSTPDKQIRKHPTTYINAEAWNNEIIIGGTGSQHTSPLHTDTSTDDIESKTNWTLDET